jgi:hypothetical protein
MIRLSREHLFSLARAFLLANTPYSLLSELANNPAVIEMHYHAALRELIEYFDFITTRAKRTEVVMGLAYGVLIAILLQLRDKGELGTLPIDPSRLQWGLQIHEYLRTSANSTGMIRIEPHITDVKIIS